MKITTITIITLILICLLIPMIHGIISCIKDYKDYKDNFSLGFGFIFTAASLGLILLIIFTLSHI